MRASKSVKLQHRLVIEMLRSIFDRPIFEKPWEPVSRPALVAWLVFYIGFLAYAFSAHGGFLFIDAANLVVHEGGHNLFGWFGPTLGLWGGTLLQWLVPFLLAVYFFNERRTAGFVFCVFFFFENWLYTATYMADARAQVLPLVTTATLNLLSTISTGSSRTCASSTTTPGLRR
ncbi:MAG: hypothetical protein WB919_09580 [Candidatus Sulfotelmatobacter sp.]